MYLHFHTAKKSFAVLISKLNFEQVEVSGSSTGFASGQAKTCSCFMGHNVEVAFSELPLSDLL